MTHPTALPALTYVGTLASASVSLAVTQHATNTGVAEELNPLLAPVLHEPLLAYSLLLASITASFLLLSASLHTLQALRPAWAESGRTAYLIVLGFWMADAARDTTLVATGVEPLASATAGCFSLAVCAIVRRRMAS